MKEMWKSIEKPETKEKLFNLVFGTSRKEGVDTKSGHMAKYDKEGSRYEPFTSGGYFPDDWPRRLYEQKPRPDYAEGINQTVIGETVLKSHLSIAVNETMALPNFFVEFKLEFSFGAHAHMEDVGMGRLAIDSPATDCHRQKDTLHVLYIDSRIYII